MRKRRIVKTKSGWHYIEDEVHIRLTSGSNGRKCGKCLGKYTVDDLG